MVKTMFWINVSLQDIASVIYCINTSTKERKSDTSLFHKSSSLPQLKNLLISRMGIWEEKHAALRMFLPVCVYRICRKQISNFLLEEHVLCLGKRSSLRSFFPQSPLCHLCRGTFPIPMETGRGAQFVSLQRTLSIKLPRDSGFSQPRQWHWDLESELPLDTWTSFSQQFSFPEPHVFLFQKSHCRTESSYHFPYEAKGIPVCSLYYLPNNIFSLDIFV